MGVTTSRPSCSCCCCFFNCVGRCLLRLILGVVYYFQWDVPSVERGQIHQEGELNTKIVMGTVTSFGNDYGWIEDCIFFSTDAIIGSIPLRTGDKVLAFVEEDPLSHELKATEVCVSSEEGVSKDADSKVKDLSVCVSQVKKNFIYIGNEYYFYLDSISKAILGFTPCEGDWLDIEYSVEQGSPKITVHSVKATQRRQLEEVCVTSIHKKKGMLNHTIFFTLDSLNLPLGYTPILGHMVNVVIIQSTQQNYKWRAISMTPISRTVVGIGPGNSSSLLFLYQ